MLNTLLLLISVVMHITDTIKFMRINPASMDQCSQVSQDNASIDSPFNSKWISEYVVITHFKISKRTLYDWHMKEGLPKYKIGKLILYNIDELNELIKKHKIISPNCSTNLNNKNND